MMIQFYHRLIGDTDSRNEFVYTIGFNGSITKWNVRLKRRVYEIDINEYNYREILISPGNRLLAFGKRDSIARIWDSSQIAVLYPSIHEIVNFSVKNNLIVSNINNKYVHVLDLRATAPSSIFFTEDCLVKKLKMTRDQKYLISGCTDGKIRIWNNFSLVCVIPGYDCSGFFKIFPNDEYLIFTKDSCNGSVWNLNTLTELNTFSMVCDKIAILNTQKRFIQEFWFLRVIRLVDIETGSIVSESTYNADTKMIKPKIIVSSDDRWAVLYDLKYSYDSYFLIEISTFEVTTCKNDNFGRGVSSFPICFTENNDCLVFSNYKTCSIFNFHTKLSSVPYKNTYRDGPQKKKFLPNFATMRNIIDLRTLSIKNIDFHLDLTIENKAFISNSKYIAISTKCFCLIFFSVKSSKIVYSINTGSSINCFVIDERNKVAFVEGTDNCLRVFKFPQHIASLFWKHLNY